MAIELSTELRTARAGVIETTIGASPTLEIRTGAVPASPATADSGTLLVDIDLPSDWLAAASSGSVAKAGTWEGVGVAAGDAGHFRIKDSGGDVHIQGTITASEGGGDMELVNVNIAVDQTVTVSSFTLTDGNA